MEILARNVNDALWKGVGLLSAHGEQVAPRGQPTLEYPGPVTTIYRRPMERVLFDTDRDANPFFHFFEGLWMLAGREDVAFVGKMVKRMYSFSDDGQRLAGAYGYRWRKAFGFDQVEHVIRMLREDPDSRRAVIAMWSGHEYMRQPKDGKDFPCNTTIYFKIRDGELRMTVCCRSNDIIWGAYGANAVHMSMLQEYVAGKLGLRVGSYAQMSDSYHAYITGDGGKLWQKMNAKVAACDVPLDPYNSKFIPMPIGAGASGWDADLHEFFRLVEEDVRVSESHFHTAYFKYVVAPMWQAYFHRSQNLTTEIAAPDWRKAASEWLARRVK